MSKAFTKESDGADDDELQLPALPAGGKNYITPQVGIPVDRERSCRRIVNTDSGLS